MLQQWSAFRLRADWWRDRNLTENRNVQLGLHSELRMKCVDYTERLHKLYMKRIDCMNASDVSTASSQKRSSQCAGRSTKNLRLVQSEEFLALSKLAIANLEWIFVWYWSLSGSEIFLRRTNMAKKKLKQISWKLFILYYN